MYFSNRKFNIIRLIDLNDTYNLRVELIKHSKTISSQRVEILKDYCRNTGKPKCLKVLDDLY